MWRADLNSAPQIRERAGAGGGGPASLIALSLNCDHIARIDEPDLLRRVIT